MPAYQPIAALALFAGFLDGSIFSPSESFVMEESTRNKVSDVMMERNTLILGIILLIAFLGLTSVCYQMYSREQKLRRSSAGPPVSMIEIETDAEEYEGRAGPGTLTSRVSSPARRPSTPGGLYAIMPTEEASL